MKVLALRLFQTTNFFYRKNNKNMPMLFAGGGFQHGRHLAFDQKDNYALPNLYLSALHQLGLQDEAFATSSGEMDGLV